MKLSAWLPSVVLLVFIATVAAAVPSVLPGYMMGYLATLNLALGALAIILIAQLFAAHWVEWMLIPLRAAAATLPVLAILTIPLWLNVDAILPWVASVPSAELSPAQRWLQSPWLILRSVVVMVIWLVIAAGMGVWPLRKALLLPIPRVVISLIVLLVTVSFFAIDWVMALVEHNVTTMIGFLLLSEQWAATLALGVIYFTRQPSFGAAAGREAGNLLLAGVMFLGYCLFMDFLIVWAANLPHEIDAYLHRDGRLMAIIAVVLFAMPIALLLFRRIKNSAKALAVVAVLVLFGHMLMVCWLLSPLTKNYQVGIGDTAVATLFTLVWLWLFTPICRYLENLRQGNL